MYKNIFSFSILLFAFSACFGQEEWILKTDKDNIKTYSRKVADSKINAVKIESVFEAGLSQFVSVILDVGSYDQWVYNSRRTRLLKQVSPAELYYYSEVIFPWPTANRDFVSHIVVRQNQGSKMINIEATNVMGMVPVNPSLVRIARSVGNWSVIALSKEKIKVVYELQVDPGGDLPAWLINPFASKGLVETFKKLRSQLKKPAYQYATLPFINN